MAVGERGLLEPSELWPQERQLCAKAAEGGLLDLRCRRPGEDDPARGRKWGPQRRIRAQVLFQLLTGFGPQLTDSVVAVRVRGARIEGVLNLGGSRLLCPLELYGCHLQWRLNLAKAQAPNISLRGSYLRSRFSGQRLQVANALNLTGFKCDSGVSLRGAYVGDQFDCSHATFSNPTGLALTAGRLVVDGSMLMEKAKAAGEVRASAKSCVRE